MRVRACLIALVAGAGCNQILGNGNFHTGGGDAGEMPPDADPCAAQGMPPTTVSGFVSGPDHLLPIYNAAVYIPTTALASIHMGVGAPTCVSGDPPEVARTDVSGHFQLGRIPEGATDLVIQVGKWRRKVPLPAIQTCADNPIDTAQTHLPSTGAEGDMPQIAITTGAADAIECLLRGIGIPDGEFAPGPDPDRHVHLFADTGTGMLGATALPGASTLFAPSELANYDIIMLGCTGMPAMQATPPNAAALRAWTDMGGWAFLTHYDYQWLLNGPLPWPTLGTFVASGTATGVMTVSIETSQPIGDRMSEWLVVAGASGAPGTFALQAGTGRNSCMGSNTNETQRRMFLDPTLNAGLSGLQSFTWDAAGGGRVTFDDVHVTGLGGTPLQSYPAECPTVTLSAQEKALLFQLFETPTCERL